MNNLKHKCEQDEIHPYCYFSLIQKPYYNIVFGRGGWNGMK